MQEYRSGHNEAVLKTVWVKAHGGSNPSSCATLKNTPKKGCFYLFLSLFIPIYPYLFRKMLAEVVSKFRLFLRRYQACLVRTYDHRFL